jgi:tetratricopeptide (TPR) repeat protein
MFLPNLRFPCLFSSLSLLILPVAMAGQSGPANNANTNRASVHLTPEWMEVERHLANPTTSTPEQLEVQGDILRARRYPEDALDYYNFALKKARNPGSLYKKMGITELEMHNVGAARIYFLKAVKANKNDADGWNNLGAVEYISRQYSAAVNDYKKAVKLNKNSATFHSNLGMAYFDKKDSKNSSIELAIALKLDPDVFARASTSGVAAQVLSPEDRARFCLEMAKTYARQGNEKEMLHSLSMASEAGMDLTVELPKDKVLAVFKNDPRVLIIIETARALKTGQTDPSSQADAGPAVKPLGTTTP